jgi:hypothetical protein
VTLRSFIKVSEKFIIDNSPTLLSGIAVTGTFTVAYLTGKATFKAGDIICKEEAMLLGGELTEKMVPLSVKARAKLVWKEYMPPSDSQLAMLDNNVIVMEKWTGRYFRSDMETIKSAENKINHDMISNMYASLSDFYDWLNLPHTQESNEVGWSIDNPMELSFTHGMAQDGRTPVLVMEYRKSPLPIRDYHHAGHGAFH